MCEDPAAVPCRWAKSISVVSVEDVLFSCPYSSAWTSAASVPCIPWPCQLLWASAPPPTYILLSDLGARERPPCPLRDPVCQRSALLCAEAPPLFHLCRTCLSPWPLLFSVCGFLPDHRLGSRPVRRLTTPGESSTHLSLFWLPVCCMFCGSVERSNVVCGEFLLPRCRVFTSCGVLSSLLKPAQVTSGIP